MKNSIFNKGMQMLAWVSLKVAKGTTYATTRFYSYQPKNDYEVYRLLNKVEESKKFDC